MKSPQKYSTFIALFFLIIPFILSSCSSKAKQEKGTQAENKLFAAEVISVKTLKIKNTESNSSITATGLITTENEARYAFKIGGIIDKIYIKEGESFQKGKLLATLKLTEIDAGVTQAKLGLEKAERDYARIQNLYKDSVATLEQLQNTKTALEIAQKQLTALSFNEQNAFIYAKNMGFVTKKLANEGEIIAGGMPVLAINESTGAAWILRVGLSDKEWAGVEIGNKAKVSIDAFPNETFEATISRKSQAADQSSGSFQVELNLIPINSKKDKNQIQFAIGMYGKATIELTQKYNSTTIPYDALIEADGKNAFVFVPNGINKVKRIPIILQSFDNENVKVASGLENIDEIIISNSAFLNEKSTISIQK